MNFRLKFSNFLNADKSLFPLKCHKISIEDDINNSLACQRNKTYKCVSCCCVLVTCWRRDKMKNRTKSNAISRRRSWTPFYACRYQTSSCSKCANAIWFSFICSRFFIFWFPLEAQQTKILQYPVLWRRKKVNKCLRTTTPSFFCYFHLEFPFR